MFHIMSDQLSTLSAADVKEFKSLEIKAVENFLKTEDHYQKCTEALVTIKKRELWRAEHKS